MARSPVSHSFSVFFRGARLAGACVIVAGCLVSARAAEFIDCQKMFLTGEYSQCIAATQEAITQNRFGESWPLLKGEAELAMGRAVDAVQTVNGAMQRYNWSVRLRWLGYEAALRAGDEEAARKFFTELTEHSQRFAWRYTDAEEIVVLGRADLLKGADAKEVLEKRFDKAKQRNPRSRDVWLVMGQLALDKHDDALAAEVFRDALKLFPEDADMHFGLARALGSAEREQAAEHFAAALKANPKHVPTLLDRAETLIDSEAYEQAQILLTEVVSINPQQPEAWTLRAVIAHLQQDPKGEQTFREKALSPWKNNPCVDHLLGRKLSQHYRFTEGAAAQRRALEVDPKFVPAQRQLAQDLLRLGQEDDGWKLAQSAHDADSYNVATFNLLELKDALDEFATLEDQSFVLRMDRKEAKLYGPEALALLNRAKRVLGDKYGLKLAHKITVEIFPNPDDFAVRTFGMPAVSGYLGVCFGKVITANSPASRREHPSNWQAVLWHEFCHVVTLELTHNRIPRWLSEGLSVYEELQANPAWGQRIDPRSREHILDGGLTPLGQLSGAFMRPQSGWHLNFAYLESALAVEFLVKQHGQAAMRNVLQDLAVGLTINDALERRCESLPNLEAAFDAFARQKAEQIAPGTDWSKPDLKSLLNSDNDEFEIWVREHPKNFIGAMAWAERLLEERKWAEAEPVLKQLIALYPSYVGGDNAYEKLARVFQELQRPIDERATLEKLIGLDINSIPARLRLIELQRAAKDWKALERTATSLLAIDPLLRIAHESEATAHEEQRQLEGAIQALERMLLLEPEDLAGTHYRLARALHASGQTAAAKRQVLLALEEAPRYRAAQELLLKIVD